MKGVTLSLTLAGLAGCAAPVSPPSAPASQPAEPGHLNVVVDASGEEHVGNLAASPADWPDLVQQWHIKTATVYGTAGTKVADMRRVQTELQQAGVSDVALSRGGG